MTLLLLKMSHIYCQTILLVIGMRKQTETPLHVLNCIKDSAYGYTVVRSLDSDVLILVIDLVAYGNLDSFTSLELRIEKGKKIRKIDGVEHVINIWSEETKGPNRTMIFHLGRLARKVCLHNNEMMLE